MRDLEVETLPGVVLGHKHIPVNSIGCYVPGGRYPMVASAHMSIVTAQGRRREAHHRLRAAVQGRPASGDRRRACISAAPTRSTCSAACRRSPPWRSAPRRSQPVDMIVGPGNAYVAEAKRQLFGRVGIDLLAGPTETLIIADDTRRRRNVRHRPARPGRARPDLAGDPASPIRKSSRATPWRRSSGC